MKKILALALTAVLLSSFAFTGCTKGESVTINVFNWGEYISDGSEGSMDVNAEFTKRTGIKVNYDTFTNNEDMYAKIKGGGVNYDIIIPSDYMVGRLISEGMLEKINFQNVPNYRNIAGEYKGLYFDPNDEYSIPYSVGMVGIIYNSKLVEGELTGWSDMWDAKYRNQILNFNNPRDAFGSAQFLLGQDVNSVNEADWRAAFEKLKEQKPLVQSYVNDEVFNKMEGSTAAIAAYFAGDYVSMSENNPDLKFVFPKEGTNIFVDSICIPKGSKNKDAAEQYINFLLEKEIATVNAEMICYASPNTTVIENEDYAYFGNEIIYPSDEIKANAQYYHNLPPETLALMSRLWDDLRIS